MLRHFTDTRTEQGRVRFLQDGVDVLLLLEGPGWHCEFRFDGLLVDALPVNGLSEAAFALALESRIPQALYLQALDDLSRTLAFFGLSWHDRRGAA